MEFMLNTVKQRFKHVHRDINPENFLFVDGRKANMKVGKKRHKSYTNKFKSVILYKHVKGGMTVSQVVAAEEINKAMISWWNNNRHKIQKAAAIGTRNSLFLVERSKGRKKRRKWNFSEDFVHKK